MSVDLKLRKTWQLLWFVLAIQGSIVVWSLASDPSGFFKYIGFSKDGAGTVSSWLLAAAITASYVFSASAISMVRQHLFARTWLKLLAVVAALAAGVLEEVVFRKWVMDYLNNRGHSSLVQVGVSAASFGVAHLLWGAKSIAAGINATLSTALLGLGLAVVYLVSGRSLAPCIVAHFIVTALIEPGLILAAVSNKLGVLRERA
jgi:membrane protease YdiL (CAAX protease family)